LFGPDGEQKKRKAFGLRMSGDPLCQVRRRQKRVCLSSREKKGGGRKILAFGWEAKKKGLQSAERGGKKRGAPFVTKSIERGGSCQAQEGKGGKKNSSGSSEKGRLLLHYRTYGKRCGPRGKGGE